MTASNMKLLFFTINLLFLAGCSEKQKDNIVQAIDRALDVADDAFFDGTDECEVERTPIGLRNSNL